MRSMLRKLAKDEAGGEVVDYVLVIGLMTVACFIIMGNFGLRVARSWRNIYELL